MHSLVSYSLTLAEVKAAQVGCEADQQAWRGLTQIQTRQTQLSHVVKATGPTLTVSCWVNQRGPG